MQHPKKIETVHVETLEGELCIYDWQRMEMHNLNPTAATVWEMCDGQTTPQQMAEQMQARLNAPYSEELVWMSLKRLEKAKLLANELIKPGERKMLTRRQMLKGMGVAAALLPVISTIVAPGPIEAQSVVNPIVPIATIISCTALNANGTIPIGPTDTITMSTAILPAISGIQMRRTITLNQSGHPQDGVISIHQGPTDGSGIYASPDFDLSTLSPTISPGVDRITILWEFVNSAEGTGTCSRNIEITATP